MPPLTTLREMTNPSCILYGPHDARYEDRPLPVITNPTDVIVRIAYTGVCGSDVHFHHHGGINHPIPPLTGITMGHESSGTVHAIGPGVTSLSPGDPVALEPCTPCRRCQACKSGRYNLCPRLRFAGVPGRCEGTLSRFFVLGEDFCHRLSPAGRGDGEGAMMEPLGVAVRSVRLGGVGPGSGRVCVFGAGTVGALASILAGGVFGASVVVGADVNERRIGFVGDVMRTLEGAGAGAGAGAGGVFRGYVSDPSKGVQETAREILALLDHIDGGDGDDDDDDDDAGFDVVIEATGAPACIQMGVEVVRAGGTFVQTGLGPRNVDFPIGRVVQKEVALKGCFRYGPGDFQLGVQLAREGRVPLKRFITRVVGFEQAVEAWEITGRGAGMKTLIRGVDVD
ncbi:GroES-like protein [Aspergillus ellipticus CBS 707.79]|uniref:D-xylulose reductase n=1 Tax=Aspergillus ellipticus CBS 707.79 TaxID=1448320 RepID=A0A319D2G2_9EURO|nr:GroES-like protein [Aspergillus ellipticus CBS 707.79]